MAHVALRRIAAVRLRGWRSRALPDDLDRVGGASVEWSDEVEPLPSRRATGVVPATDLDLREHARIGCRLPRLGELLDDNCPNRKLGRARLRTRRLTGGTKVDVDVARRHDVDEIGRAAVGREDERRVQVVLILP